MSKFLTPLIVQQLEDTSHDGRGTWQLQAMLAYLSDAAGRVIIAPKGFITDFASVPRIPVAYLLAGDCAHQAAVIHDFLYSSHEVERAVADAVLREAAICSGVPPWRAWAMWSAVRLAGGSHWDAPATPQLSEIAPLMAEAN
jgi:hypothetical protein